MGDAPVHPVLPRMRGASLSIDTSQTSSAQPTQRASIKLDIRDVVRREGYRTDLNARVQRDEFRGNTREEQRMQRRDAFWNHVNKGVAYSWVSDRGLVVSDEEKELAFKYYRGGEGIGWLSENSVWSKLSIVPNAPSREEFTALELFERDGISWDDLHKQLVDNELADYDPVREAFALLDGTNSGTLSRAQVKEMAEKWGIGEITEDDVDDLFRAVGVNPATQPSITLPDYRDLVRIDLSKKEGVRVKLLDQLAEQPMVIIAQDPKITFSTRSPPSARASARGTSSLNSPTSPTRLSQSYASSPTSPTRSVPPLAQSYNSPSSPTRITSSLSHSFTNSPSTPTRATPPLAQSHANTPSSPTHTPSTLFPGLRLDSPTRATSPAQPMFSARPTSPSRPTSAHSTSPSHPPSARPTSAHPSSTPPISARPTSARPTSEHPTAYAPPTSARPTSAHSTSPIRPASARPTSPLRAASPPARIVAPPASPDLSSRATVRPLSPGPSLARSVVRPASPRHSLSPPRLVVRPASPASPAPTGPVSPSLARSAGRPASPTRSYPDSPASPTLVRSAARSASPAPTGPASPSISRSARPASPRPSLSRSPVRPSSPAHSPTRATARPSSPAPRPGARPASPAPSPPRPAASSTPPAHLSTRQRSSTTPTKIPVSAPLTPSPPSLRASRIEFPSEKPHSVAFAPAEESEDDSDDDEKPNPIAKTVHKPRSTKEKLERVGSTGSMKLNLAISKAEEMLKNAPLWSVTPAISTKPPNDTHKSNRARLKDMYNNPK